MRFSRLRLENFRSCDSVAVDFSEDLTVIVGENASGKSAVIDAVRLATTPAIEGAVSAFRLSLIRHRALTRRLR